MTFVPSNPRRSCMSDTARSLDTLLPMHAAAAPLLVVLLALAPSPARADAVRTPGEELEKILSQRQADAFTAKVDVDVLLERVLTGSGLSPDIKVGFVKGFRDSIGGMGAGLVRNLDAQHATVRLVLSRATAEGTTQLIRLDMHKAGGAAAGHDYIEFDLGADGRIRDMRSHAQGAWTSDVMRVFASTVIDNRSFLGRLFNGGSELTHDTESAVRDFTAAMLAQDFRAAYDALDRMPDAFRDTRQWLVLRAALSSRVDPKLHAADLEIVAKRHGADPDVQFMLIDYYFSRHEYDKMIAAVQQFERRVVVDGAQKNIECRGYFLLERYAEAEHVCRDGIRIEGDYIGAWWTLADVLALERQPKELFATLDEIQRRFGKRIRNEKLVTLQGYEWLADDAAFKEWAKGRP